MLLRYENKTEIPKENADDFVSFEEDGKEIFLHKDLAEAKKETYRFKGDLTRVSGDLESAKSKLGELEQAEKDRAEELEKAKRTKQKANGQQDEIIADLEKKLADQEANFAEREKKLVNERRTEQKSALVEKLASAGTDETRRELSRLISLDLAFNEKGGFVVNDVDGKATAQTIDEYADSLAERYPSLVKAVHSKGGIGSGGQSGRSGGASGGDFGGNKKERQQAIKKRFNL